MALNLPTFYKRTGSAVVFVIIMLAGLLWNEWAFLALVCVIQFLCFKEYTKLMQRIYPSGHWPKAMLGIFEAASFIILISVAVIIYLLHNINNGTLPNNINVIRLSGFFWQALPVLPAVFLLTAILSKKEFLLSFVLCIAGILYISLPMIFLLYMYNVNNEIYTHKLPLILIVLIWINDTMAYLVGSFFGKTPFSPISPKKTWEGTIGGALLTIIVASIYSYFDEAFTTIDLMALAACAAIAGTLGDLMESKLKRMADVKDSGNIMPGHGGALDRFDSLLIATPFAFIYVLYFMS